jgi:hypothetical protein
VNSIGNLLLAVQALHHRRVRVYLHRYRLAVAERENFDVFASFVADSHVGNRHDRIAVSEEAGHLLCHGLLAQPPEVLASFAFAVIRTADRASAWLPEHLWCLLL